MKNNMPMPSNQQNPSDYAANLPYPPIQITATNTQYAALLLRNYASAISEFSSINRYNYQSLMTMNNNSDLSNALHQIAVVEMHHLYTLGQLIVMLGGNPQYISIQKNHMVYWNGRMLSYNCEPSHLLQHNISAEQYAIDAYRHHCTIIEDPYIQVLLKRIILDEEVHLKVFNEFLTLC